MQIALKAIGDLLGAVPDIVWSGALGALLTLFGVLISNSESRKRLRIQLAHERDLRMAERNSHWQRELYADILTSIEKVIKYLGTAAVNSKKERAKEQVGEAIEELSFLVNKCASMSSAETLKIIGCIEELIQRFELDTKKQLREAQSGRDEIDRVSRAIKGLRREGVSLVKKAGRLTILPITQDVKHKARALQKQFQSLEEDRSRLRAQSIDIAERYFPAALDFSDKHDALCDELGGLCGALIVRVRSELGFEEGKEYEEWLRHRNTLRSELQREVSEDTRKFVLAAVEDIDAKMEGLRIAEHEVEERGRE